MSALHGTNVEGGRFGKPALIADASDSIVDTPRAVRYKVAHPQPQGVYPQDRLRQLLAR